MSYYKRTEKESPRRAHKAVGKQWGDDKPLSPAQRTELAIYARDAYGVMQRAGLVDGNADDWRREQVMMACGYPGLSKAFNKHFRAIKGHFLRLAGNEAEAKKTFVQTGRVKGSKEQHDTHENREQKFNLIMGLVTSGKIDAGLVPLKAKDKFGTMDLNTLTNKQLQQLYMTLKGRARAPRAN